MESPQCNVTVTFDFLVLPILFCSLAKTYSNCVCLLRVFFLIFYFLSFGLRHVQCTVLYILVTLLTLLTLCTVYNTYSNYNTYMYNTHITYNANPTYDTYVNYNISYSNCVCLLKVIKSPLLGLSQLWQNTRDGICTCIHVMLLLIYLL